MLGNKPLSEIRKEISKRFKEAGIDEAQLREQLRQLRPVKRKKRVTVATMLGLPEPKTPKPARNPAAVKALVNFAKPVGPKRRTRSAPKSRG